MWQLKQVKREFTECLAIGWSMKAKTHCIQNQIISCIKLRLEQLSILRARKENFKAAPKVFLMVLWQGLLKHIRGCSNESLPTPALWSLGHTGHCLQRANSCKIQACHSPFATDLCPPEAIQVIDQAYFLPCQGYSTA